MKSFVGLLICLILFGFFPCDNQITDSYYFDSMDKEMESSMNREFVKVTEVKNDCFFVDNGNGEVYRINIECMPAVDENDILFIMYNEKRLTDDGYFRVNIIDISKSVNSFPIVGLEK